MKKTTSVIILGIFVASIFIAINTASASRVDVYAGKNTLDNGNNLINTILSAKNGDIIRVHAGTYSCLLYTSPSPRDRTRSRMPSSA